MASDIGKEFDRAAMGVGNGLAKAATTVGDLISELIPGLEETEQQQHDADNVTTYGSSPSGKNAILGDKFAETTDPEREVQNTAIDLEELVIPGVGGLGPKINPFRGLAGFQDKVDKLIPDENEVAPDTVHTIEKIGTMTVETKTPIKVKP